MRPFGPGFDSRHLHLSAKRPLTEHHSIRGLFLCPLIGIFPAPVFAMRILFATDLSEPAGVTEAVERLAERLDAELLVLHVVAPAPSASADPAALSAAPMAGFGSFAPYTSYDPALEENLERAEAHAFHRFLTERFHRSVRPALRKGEPATTILDDAEEHDVDLVALGKHRRGRLARFFLGSTAKKVLDDNPRPTLLFPVPDEE